MKMATTWLDWSIRRHGRTPSKGIDKKDDPQKLLGWGTQQMILLYHKRMVAGIAEGKVPEEGAWAYATQVTSLTQLVNYLLDKVGIPLWVTQEVDADDTAVKKLRKDEFLFTFLIKRGDVIVHRYMTRVPKKAFGKGGVVDYKHKQIYIEHQALTDNKMKLLGNDKTRILSPQEIKSGMNRECLVCGSRENLQLCGKCKRVYYCSPKHQKADWRQHKISCVQVEGLQQGKSVKTVAEKNGFSEDQIEAAAHDIEIINATSDNIQERIEWHRENGSARQGTQITVVKLNP